MGRTLAAVDTDRACSKEESSGLAQWSSARFVGRLCPKGTVYDPIRNGECWACPDGYERTVFRVDSDNACVKPLARDYKRATEHSAGTGFFGTDCPSGQWWDISDGKCHSCPSGYAMQVLEGAHSSKKCLKVTGAEYDKATVQGPAKCNAGEIFDWKISGAQDTDAGGGCWTCPTYYDRSLYPIDEGKACEASPKVTFSAATKKSALTCEVGQHFDFIGVTQTDINTRDDIPSSTKPIQSGTCWSCPEGYDRTTASVKSSTACRAKTIGWQSAGFTNPGLFGLAGAKGVLLQIVRDDPVFVREALEKVAETVAKTGNASKAQALADEKAVFVSNPAASPTAAGLVFARLLSALGQDASVRTTDEQTLINSFAEYVRARRTHIAEDALAAYDAWKEADDYYRSSERGTGLQNTVDFGTVPPNFETIAMVNAMGMGALSTSIGLAAGNLPLVGDVLNLAIGGTTGFANFSDGDTAARFVSKTAAEVAIGKAIELALARFAAQSAEIASRNAFVAALSTSGAGSKIAAANAASSAASKSVLAAAGSAGPQIIIGAATIIAQIAIEQADAIANARPRLETSLAGAKQTPQLARMAQTDKGISELLTQWSFAMSGQSLPNSTFMQLYGAAAVSALDPTATAASSSAAVDAARAATNASDTTTPRAALTLSNGKTYFFYSNNTYTRYSEGATGLDRGYPRSMAGGAGGWKIAGAYFTDGPTAALRYQQSDTRYYMFRDNDYIRLTHVTMDRGYPAKMPGGWTGLPTQFRSALDAAFYNTGIVRNVFLKGDQVMMLDGLKPVSGFPKQISQVFRKLPTKFQRDIDAATYRDHKIYLIKDGEYMKLSGGGYPERGYPKPLSQFPN